MVIVNCEEMDVTSTELSFADIVALAGYKYSPYFTVVYHKGHSEKPEGIMIASDTVRVKDGMIINVAMTGNA